MYIFHNRCAVDSTHFRMDQVQGGKFCHVCDTRITSAVEITVNGLPVCGIPCADMSREADQSSKSDNDEEDATEDATEDDQDGIDRHSADDTSENANRPPGKRVQYTFKQKRQVLLHLQHATVAAVSRQLNIPYTTVRNWKNQKDIIGSFNGSEKRRSLRTGRKQLIDFPDELVCFMKDLRRESRPLATVHLVNFIKLKKPDWLVKYLSTKKTSISGYNALFRLLQRFAHRHGFSRQIITRSTKSLEDLLAIRDNFSEAFWAAHGHVPQEDILNVDETGVYYDMPPSRIWALRGGSAKVASVSKQSSRVTAVMAIRSNGEKLPILFILKGTPGGRIESTELGTYPEGHFYTVQQNAWMDGKVWTMYLDTVLKPEIRGPSVILLDNLDVHVSETSINTVAGELFSTVVPLPANTTSVTQPLDVEVMGPLKSKLRAAWLTEDIHSTRMTAKQNRLAIVKRTISAWEVIQEETVRSSFRKALP